MTAFEAIVLIAIGVIIGELWMIWMSLRGRVFIGVREMTDTRRPPGLDQFVEKDDD